MNDTSDQKVFVDEQSHILDSYRLGEKIFADGFEPIQGTSCTVLTADQVSGTFANTDGEVVSKSGDRFKIQYSPSAVTLIKMSQGKSR